MGHAIKQKRERLQHLKALDSLHDRVDEIQNLKKEINEALSREEVMWAQRSRALWMKWGDRNTKFFMLLPAKDVGGIA